MWNPFRRDDRPDPVLYILGHLVTLIGDITMTLADIQSKITTVVADTAAIKTADASAVTALQGLTALLADVKSQLAAAIAANDPAAIQAAADSLDAVHATLTDQTATLAAAVAAVPAQ